MPDAGAAYPPCLPSGRWASCRHPRPCQPLPRYSLTSGGVAPQLRPTWIPLTPSTVLGPSCDHRGPAVARHWHPGANVDPQSLRVWYQVLYILHRTLAARMFPLRDHSSRVNRWDFLPPAGRRPHMGISQPCVVVDGQFPGLTPGPDTRISLFRLPVDFEVRAALLASLVGARTACG